MTTRRFLLCDCSVACFALVAIASCSDPALPVASGAASLRWDASTGGNQHPACVPGAHWSNAPVATNDAPSVTARDVVTPVLVEGRDASTIRCRVAPRGDAYVVSAQLHALGTDPGGGARDTEVDIDVVIGEGQDAAQGTVYVADETSHFAFSSDTAITPPKPGCLFSVHPAEGEQLGIAPGRVWARVQCPHIQDNRNRAKQECQIAEGYIVLRDCVRD